MIAALRLHVERLRGASDRWELPTPAAVAWVALAVIATWGVRVVDPSEPGGDHDYWYLLDRVARNGADFGDEVSTTYGPWYFLTVTAVDAPWHVLVADVVWLVIAVGFLSAVLQGLDRILSRRDTFVVMAFLVVGIAATPLAPIITTTVVLLLVTGIQRVRGDLPVWAHRAYPAAAAAVTALMAFNKFSVGGMCGLVALGAILASDRRRRDVLEFVFAGPVVALVAFVAVGQSVTSLPSYVFRSLAVGSGQAGAMGLEVPQHEWEYLALGVGLAAAAWAFARLVGMRWSVLPFYVGTAAAMVFLTKQGFVRHDGHSAQVLAALTAVVVLGAVVAGRQAMIVVAAGLALSQVSAFGTSATSIDPVPRVAKFGQGLWTVVSGEYRQERLDAGRAALVASPEHLVVPDDVLAEIGDGTVYTEPFNRALGFVYGYRDAILPTILEYGAYNQELDEANVEWFENDSTSPDFVLRENTGITLDGRRSAWDAPRQKLFEACHYDAILRSGSWTLLERRETSRCGESEDEETVEVAAGESVDVPSREGMMTVATIEPRHSLWATVQGAVYKPAELYVTLGGYRFRLPWGHTDTPLIVDGYDHPTGTWTRNGDYDLAVSEGSKVTFAFVPVEDDVP